MLRKLISPKFILIFTLVVLLGVILVVSYSALSASNIVPLTRLGLTAQAIVLSDLMPAECSAITIANIVYCTGGNCNGTDANDLMFGTSGVDDIQGGKGNDCILAGGGNDDLKGEQGTSDVCLGGPGTNNYHPSCEYSSP